MSAKLRWDNAQKTVIRFDFEQGWSWSDLEQVLQKLDQVSAERNHRVDAIVDVRHVDSAAHMEMLRFPVMENGKAFARRAASTPAIIVTVGASSVFRAMYQRYHILQTSAPANLHFTATVEEARQIIALAQLRDIIDGLIASA